MVTLKLLDLCCGGGGAGVGYYRAGFDVTGVDIQKNIDYPLRFVQRDAIDFLIKFGHRFDVIHVSPDCRGYSVTKSLSGRSGGQVELFRMVLNSVGKPWVIENVVGAPIDGVTLCGQMFGLNQIFRHRVFETSFFCFQPEHQDHATQAILSIAGNYGKKALGMAAMGIDWHISAWHVRQAVPPAYTQYIGSQALLNCFD